MLLLTERRHEEGNECDDGGEEGGVKEKCLYERTTLRLNSLCQSSLILYCGAVCKFVCQFNDHYRIMTTAPMWLLFHLAGLANCKIYCSGQNNTVVICEFKMHYKCRCMFPSLRFSLRIRSWEKGGWLDNKCNTTKLLGKSDLSVMH